MRRGARTLAARAGIALAAILAAAGDGFALGLERSGVIVPRGSDAGAFSPSSFWYDDLREALIVALPESRRVLVLDREGNVRRELGKADGLEFPRVVAASRDGKLYIGGRESERLLVLEKYDAQGDEEYRTIDLASHRKTAAVQPVSLFADAQGRLYVADRGNRQLLVLGPDDKLRHAIADVGEPSDVWADRSGRIYVSDPAFGGVRVYDERGGHLRTLGSDPARYREPLRGKGIAVDRRGFLWVLEEGGRGIRALDPLGNLRFSLGGEGLFGPVDLAVDSGENLYVLEQGGARITVYRITGF